MSNLLETGSDYLQAQLKQFASSEVAYRRGQDSVVVKAIIGSTKVEVDDGGGAKIKTDIIDFLISTADLVLNGSAITPQHGDKIELGSCEYEVLFLAGDGCWRFSDAFGKTMRIHTKRTGDVS
ncbi:MAG: hypothetical protein WC496_02810 [Phycisphaerae bacterium]|jgi:hypothetical protein